MSDMSASIQVVISGATDTEVRELIGQDPMGDLAKKMTIKIGKRSFKVSVEGYSSTNGTVTLHFDTVSE
jgi:hypothetical protein